MTPQQRPDGAKPGNERISHIGAEKKGQCSPKRGQLLIFLYDNLGAYDALLFLQDRQTPSEIGGPGDYGRASIPELDNPPGCGVVGNFQRYRFGRYRS
jgi:hypothetical protein